MKSELVKTEGGRATLKVTVPVDEFKSYIDEALKELAKEVNVPGFRKGKAPKQIILSRLGEGYVLSEAASHAVSHTYMQAIQESGVKVFSEPVYDVEQLESGKDFIYNIIVDVLPDIELPEYKGINVTKKVAKATDAEVDEVLAQMQKRHSQLVAVEDRDTVEEGDHIIFDFKVFVDGEPFEGGAAENYALKIGSGTFIPGFEEQMVGKKLGEKSEITVTFPEDYHMEALQGKETVFEVKVNEIKKEVLPELDDEFAKDVSDKETLAEYREQIKKDLDENFERISRNKLEDEILAKLLEATSFDPPPSMVDMQAQQLLEEMKTNLAYQGISWEFYLQRTEQDEEALKENFKPRALHQVKNYFLLKEIALKEGIEVSDEELDARIEELAEQFQMTKEQLREYYEKSGQLGSLRSEIETEKTLQFLVDNAIIEEQVVDPKELS